MNTRMGEGGVARYGVAAMVAALALLLVAPTSAHAQSPVTGIPVAGTFDGGTFAGALDVVRFEQVEGALVAVGTLRGALTDTDGAPVGVVTDQAVTLPVASIAATCDILHLDLGPLDLDLLGLVVHLDRVVLDIDADAGGGLLGGLLCALAGLLNPIGFLDLVIAILNRILEILTIV